MVAVPASFWSDIVPTARTALPLASLPKGCWATITAVAEPDVSATNISMNRDSVEVEVIRRLRELGFLAGEHVKIIARGLGGVEPIAVRIGTATFALRRFEADCIQVQPLAELPLSQPHVGRK